MSSHKAPQESGNIAESGCREVAEFLVPGTPAGRAGVIACRSDVVDCWPLVTMVAWSRWKGARHGQSGSRSLRARRFSDAATLWWGVAWAGVARFMVADQRW